MKSKRHNIYAHNDNYSPIENWYTLVAGFSGNFVLDTLKKYEINSNHIFLDPFVGTGTSVLVTMFNKIKSYGIDINPFNHIVAKAKTNIDIDLKTLDRQINKIENKLQPIEHKEFIWKDVPTTEIKDHLSAIGKKTKANLQLYNRIPPNLPNLEQWISPDVVNDVLLLRETVSKCNMETLYQPVKDFTDVAFASILLNVSNMQLSGPKIAYRRKQGKRRICIDAPVIELFLEKLKQMRSDVANYGGQIFNSAKPNLILGDAREVDHLIDDKIDISITSPPYLNEVCYLDNTKMELFFLDLVNSNDELKSLKKRQVRGNSKYLYQSNKDYPHNVPKGIETFDDILGLCEIIKSKWEKRNWGWDHPRLVAEYFIDMSNHLHSMLNVLKENSKYIMVVGDSAIDKILVPTDELLAKLALDIGFSSSSVEPFRLRGSSRHSVKLRESIITLTS